MGVQWSCDKHTCTRYKYRGLKIHFTRQVKRSELEVGVKSVLVNPHLEMVGKQLIPKALKLDVEDLYCMYYLRWALWPG